MRGKRFICALILALLLLPTAARADVLIPGMRPPRNEQSEAFVKLYADRITGWDSAYDDALKGVEEIVLWQYPGSGVKKSTMNADWFGGPKGGPGSKNFDTCYKDDQGRFWVYVRYAYGTKLAWACLSDPTNPKLPADHELVAAVNREAILITWRENGPAVSLVLGLVVGTGVLLYVLWYRAERKWNR